MGTRSLFGYVKEDGNIHVQYMQLDGYPSVKGREYYETVARSVEDLRCFDKKGQPDATFFARIQAFLDNYQFASGHSVGSQHECTQKEWKNQDCWQEWQYLWERNGNFRIFDCHNEENSFEMIIPWEVTKAVSAMLRMDLGKEQSHLVEFWDALDHWEKDKKPPTLTAETCLVHAFPDQKKNGWRIARRLLMNGKQVEGASDVFGGMLHDKSAKKKEKKRFRTSFTSEYLRAKRAKAEALPVLLTSLTNAKAKELVERRLAGLGPVPTPKPEKG